MSEDQDSEKITTHELSESAWAHIIAMAEINGDAERAEEEDREREAFANYLEKTSEARERATELSTLPDFGIGILDLQQAAELVVIEMWFDGLIESAELEEVHDFDGDERDPRLKAALATPIKEFVDRFSNAVNTNRLEAVQIRRDLDENIDPSNTFIREESLAKWLYERGLGAGDVFHSWLKNEHDIASTICDEIVWLRSLYNQPREARIARHKTTVDESNHQQVKAAYRAEALENQHLRERLARAEITRHEKPVTTKERTTLLTIIAALANQAGIDAAQRGAARQIQEAVERIGATVTDDTIRKVLKAIPDAVDRRTA